jgi:RNA-directed DNA polymerase
MSREAHVRFCESGGVRFPSATHLVILCRARPEVYLAAAKAVLDRLGLALNEQKTRVVDVRRESFDFLGNRFVVQPSKRTGAIRPYYYPAPKAMKAVKQKIREAVRRGQHRSLPDLIRERINPVLRGWGNYFKTGNSRRHFMRIANYTTWTLCIMLRKKYQKRSKGWRDHPPSWFYNYHGLFKLYGLLTRAPDRYGRLVTP